MQGQETPPAISIGPQLFKDTLYGDAETGWLTIFYTPSRLCTKSRFCTKSRNPAQKANF